MFFTVSTAINEATALAAQVKADGHRIFVTTSGPNGGLRILHVSSCPSVVPLDVVPGSEANWVPMTVSDPIPVQILGSSSLDVANIATASLRFGPAAAAPMNTPGFEPTVGDVNGDGFDDLVVYFHADAAGLGPYDQQACLEGQLAGASFKGCDWVSVNQPPVALIFDDPHRGIAPLWVTFDGRASYDPEGGSLLYEWEFDGWAEPASGPTVAQFLPVPGSYEATLTVEDDYGQRRTTTFVAKALDVPEVATLTPSSLAVLATLVLYAGNVLLRRPRCVP